MKHLVLIAIFIFHSQLLFYRNLTSEVLVQLRIKLMLKNIKDANLLGAIEPFGMVLDGEEFIENPIQFVQNGRWKEDTRFIILGSTIEEMNHIQSYIPQFIQLRKTQFEVGAMRVVLIFSPNMNTICRKTFTI